VRVDPRHGPRAQGIRGRSACADGWPRASTDSTPAFQGHALRERLGSICVVRRSSCSRLALFLPATKLCKL